MTRIKRLAAIACAAVTCAIAANSAAAETYIYSYEGKFKESPPLYVLEDILDLSYGLETPLKEPRSFFVDESGKLYVADTENNRILLFSAEGTLTGFEAADGQPSAFNKPADVYIDHNRLLYIADTENERIVVLKPDFTLDRILLAPSGSGIPSDFVFKPVSIAVDSNERIYCISKSSNMGVLSFKSSGAFEGFMGASIVKPNPIELFWRRFMTEEQLKNVAKMVPTEFNSLALDADGFVYVTTASLDKESQYNSLINRDKSNSFAPIRRLNPSGSDVLSRNGFFPPAGDVELRADGKMQEKVTSFVGVAIGRYGVYSAIDNTNKKVFTYDADGNLLNVMGGEGIAADKFSALAKILYVGDDLWILDSYTGKISIYTLSDYGEDVMTAIRLTDERKFNESLQQWENLLEENGNLEMAYIGMGKSYMKKHEYQKAMECYELVNHVENYSEAFSKYRNEYIGQFILLIPFAAGLLIFVVLLLFKKVKAFNKAGDMEAVRRRTLKEELLYGFYSMFHPFDGFDEIKRRKRGGIRGALVYFVLGLLVFTVHEIGSGYIFSGHGHTSAAAILKVMASFALPFLVWCVGNWCVTSLMYGEGGFGNIFVTTAYSMLPLILILAPCTLIANFLTLEEGNILGFAVTLAYVWSFALIFFGMIAIHGYSLGKNIGSTLLSLIAMLIIAFMSILMIALLQKMGAFFVNLFEEITYRL